MKERVRLSQMELADLLSEHSELPDDYVAYLRDTGWGETPGGYMIYSRPIAPEEVYGEIQLQQRLLLFGDDSSGHCLGYDLDTQCYGEVSDSGEWIPLESEMTIVEFLSQYE